MRTIKAILLLGLAGAAGLLAYAHLGDLTPPQREVVIELPLQTGD